MLLSSIKDLLPTEVGGRIARKGFVYQDHVAVKFLIDIISEQAILEIWIEGEDDIVLLHPSNKDVIVEMIQVKSNDLDSRWTIPKICSLELLPKSIYRGRCAEPVLYRVVTCVDIDSELAFLKIPTANKLRDNSSIDQLMIDYKDKFTLIKSNVKGHGVKDWFSNCFWEVLSKLDALKAENLLYLERCLVEKYSLILPPDQKTEIYQKLLAFVSIAGVSGKKYNFTKIEILEWFDSVLQDLAAPLVGSERLKKKLLDARLPDETLQTANEFRWKFEQESLNYNFYSRTKINQFKDKIHLLIQTLKLSYDNGESFSIDGIETTQITDSQFHKYCWDKVKTLANDLGIEENIALGCMYDNTNRCTHRFTKARI